MSSVVFGQRLTINDLMLEWALRDAGRPRRSTAAQHVRSDGALVYAVPLAEKLALVASDCGVKLTDASPPFSTRSIFSPEGIRRFRDGERLPLAEAIARVHELLAAHVWFAEGWQPDLIALWVMGTFLYQLFTFYGYLQITSPTKRCGKSQLLDLLSLLAFNATPPTADPSPAFIFRDAERNCGTQLFDEVEQLAAARGGRANLMAMLNVGFMRGSRVSRAVGSRSDGFREFNVFAPRVLAGISQLPSTVADRSFRIELFCRPQCQMIERLNFRLQATALARLRDDLHIAALGSAREVAERYDRIHDLALPFTGDDRLRDILEPLFAIASAADSKAGEDRHTQSLIIGGRALAQVRAKVDAAEIIWAWRVQHCTLSAIRSAGRWRSQRVLPLRYSSALLASLRSTP